MWKNLVLRTPDFIDFLKQHFSTASLTKRRGVPSSAAWRVFLLGKQGVHPHQLRHTFITGLVRAKEDIAVIQYLSGHASADMILRYSQPSEEERQRAVENLFSIS